MRKIHYTPLVLAFVVFVVCLVTALVFEKTAVFWFLMSIFLFINLIVQYARVVSFREIAVKHLDTISNMASTMSNLEVQLHIYEEIVKQMDKDESDEPITEETT